MYLLSSLVCLYNFREKGLFLGGQNVISWGGHKGGLGGICPPPPPPPPPSLYVKKGPVLNGYVTNPNPSPTLTPNPNRNPNSNPNQINEKIQKETTLKIDQIT